MRRIVIIGGGVAGLGAAYKIRRAADEGHDVGFILVEKDDRLGGKILTERRDGFIIDAGCDSFLTMKTAVHRIARIAGIEDHKMPTDDSRKRTMILKKGRLYEMPDGVMQFAPTKFWPFATTGLFSWPGKLRAGMDLFVPKKRVPEGELNDETLEHFILRRMGREILDRLAEPLVGGVHASDPAVMSLAATFPNLLQMEQDHGSMIMGFLAQRRKVEEIRKKYPPDPKNPRTVFTSFRKGFQQLTDTMADRAGREDMRTGAKVLRLERSGDGWRVFLSDGDVLEAAAVVVATEGWAASALLSNVDEQLGADIGGIQHSSSATVSLAWDTDDLGFDLDAFGLLCPLVEGRSMMAASYSSTKWPGRAPEGSTVMRGFVGGPHNQAIMENDDDALVDIVLREFRDIFGLRRDPLFARVGRWTNGMPQYTLGHLDRVGRIERRVAAIAGIGVGGGSYRGVGVPNCIESGEAAARKVMAEWGVAMAEDEVEEKRYY
jgi:oxygen-dependent protoporphyrinogen oxidase